MKKNFTLKLRYSIFLALILTTISTLHAQQWLGQNNSDSVLYRHGGLTIGQNTTVHSANAVWFEKQFVVRKAENGDLVDIVNEASNLVHGSDVIWGVLCGPQPNNPGLFHLNTRSGPYNGSVQKEIFMVRYNGNVGIGTGEPAYKLDVNGTIHSKEIIVDSLNWPDYVFKKEYPLKTLSELDTFLKKNNHLPNIPSAREIESEGLNVGNMISKLTEKIEELTLYTIDQDKKYQHQQMILQDLQHDNQILKKKIKQLEPAK